MTAEPDLLPLPDVKRWRAMKDRNGNVGYSDKPDPKYSESAGTDSLTWVRLNDHAAAMQAYARANLAELQREVATWKGLHASEVQVRQRWQARAEQLAGALRRMTGLALEVVPALEATRVNVSLAADVKQAADAARAAPDQETTNG